MLMMFFKENVLNKLKSKLVFQKMVDNDSSEVTELDLENELIKQAQNLKMAPQDVKKFYKERNLFGLLKDEIKRQKVKEKILQDLEEIKLEKVSFRDFVNYKTGE
ncbi:Trigger factor, ppiase [Borrelia duttonii CR2A]|uniref:Trigger factor, ppiase n=1 Tax=Borrelia duttonii CR2A TaxID=1432657 RepID=W6U099_9SPIR|nr:Trigger factor, ppiase [Borrelia duttonii CR2A]